MLKWTIGAVTVTRVVELELPIPYDEAQPFLRDARPEALKDIPWLEPHFVTPDGALRLSIHALLVQTPTLKLVVDTCVGNDRPRSLLRGTMLQTPFLEHIAAAGFPRESVDAVVCTHLHVDHVGWNTMLESDRWVPTFPNARYLIGRTEYEHWHSVDHDETQTILSDSVKPVIDAGLVQLVETDHRIGPELRLMPTPGHTPGHVSVVIESEGACAVITGDMLHHPCQFAHPEWAPDFDSSREESVATRRTRFAEWAASRPLVIGTHFAAPTAGRVRRDGDAYRFEV